MSEDKANPETGYEVNAASQAPLTHSQGAGTGGSQLLGNTLAASGSLNKVPPPDMGGEGGAEGGGGGGGRLGGEGEGGRGGGEDCGGSGRLGGEDGGGGKDVREGGRGGEDGGGEGEGGREAGGKGGGRGGDDREDGGGVVGDVSNVNLPLQSNTKMSESHSVIDKNDTQHGQPQTPTNLGGIHGQPQQTGSGIHRQPPQTGPGILGQPPQTGPGIHGQPPQTGPGYYGYPSQTGPGGAPMWMPMYPFPYQGPQYQYTHPPYFPPTSLPSKGESSQEAPPSQVPVPHPRPAASPSWGGETGTWSYPAPPYPQPHGYLPPHGIMPTHAMGHYGQGWAPPHGTHPPCPGGPPQPQPQPHPSGSAERSSTPSSENEAEQVCIEDEFRVLVENASSATHADCIQNFLEAKTELTVETVLPASLSGAFLVTFKEKPDIGELKTHFMKRPIEDSWLKVTQVLQSASVKVTSLRPDTTDDNIKFYFMNRRKSGGGEVKAVTRSPDHSGAVVYFYDPEVAKRVCEKSHKLNTHDVIVTLHHDLLDTWGGKDESSPGTAQASRGAATHRGPIPRQSSWTPGQGHHRSGEQEPEAGSRSTRSTDGGAQTGRSAHPPQGTNRSAAPPQGTNRSADPPQGTNSSVIIKTLDNYVVCFLSKSSVCQKEFVKFIGESLHGIVRFIPQPKDRVMLMVEHTGSVNKLSSWKASIGRDISEYVSKYLKVECLHTSVPECLLDEILTAVNPILKSRADLVKLYQGTEMTDLIICGTSGLVDSVKFQISKVKQSSVPVSPPRTESCNLKPFQANYLPLSKFEDMFPKVNTRIDTQKDIVTFEGPSADVLSAKLECLRIVQNLIIERTPFKTEEAMKLLRSHKTADFIQKKLNSVRCVWGCGNKEVLIYAETEADAKKGRNVFETSLTELTIAVDTATEAVLRKAEWGEKRSGLLEAHQGKLELVQQKGNLLILCTSDIGGSVREEVEKFLSMNALRSKSLPLEASTAKFLNMFKSNEIRLIEGKLEKHQVKIIVDEGIVSCELKISGYQKGFADAEKLLNKMTSQIFSKQHKIVLPGIEEFFVKGKGRELLSAVEQNVKCIIQPKDMSPEKKEKKKREMRRWDVPSGGVLSVILGDMRDLAVDAIVNAANRDLQHGGGVAKAIVDKGGNAIVKYCDQYIKENGPLVDAEAVCSPAGSLPCKVVIHAVGPVWAGGDQGEEEVLRETVGNILKVAEANNIQSIAIPAISSGIFGYPLQDAITAIMEALLDMWRPDPEGYTCLQHVYLCDIKTDTVGMFVKVGNKLFEKDRGSHGDSDSVDSSEESVLEEEPVHYSNSGSESEDASDTESTRGSTYVASDEGDTDSPGINVVSKELALVKADVLVNPAQCDLDLNSGAVSRSLLKAAGPKLQEECERKYEEGINLGEVAVTKGGNLQCKVVFHGLLLKWNNGKGKAEKVLRTLVTECLTEADSSGYTSIAFPALGTGRQGFPADIAADLMFSSVRTFLDTNSASPLQTVYFVVHPSDRAVFKAFKAESERPYSDSDWMSSTPSPYTRPASRGRGGSFRGRRGSSRRHRTFGGGQAPVPPSPAMAAPGGVPALNSLFGVLKGMHSSSPTGTNYKLGPVTVVIAQGDVTMETTDCIVNCCKDSCDLNYSAISKAILRAAGPVIQQECFEKKHSMTKYGYVLTSGGNLKCKMVAHLRAQQSNYGWTKVLSQCMDWVNKKGVSSMSIPALGTGGLKQSPEKMASAIYDAINKYGASHPAPSLSQVRVVIFQDEMLNGFRTVFAGGRPRTSSSHSAQDKRGHQEARSKRSHRRSKTSHHKSPDDVIDTSNKHIDDSVVLCIYTDDKKNAEAAKQRITMLCKEEFEHKALSKSWNEFIGKLKAKEVSSLYRIADDNGVALSKTAHGLTLTGKVRLVSAAYDIIAEKLQTLQKKSLMQREARTLAQLVEWVYVDEKGRSTPFTPGINCQLEKARNDKVKTLEIEDFKGRKYKIDLEARLEYPPDGSKPLTINRIEKGAPSGLGRYVEGEKEALAGSTTVYFSITPERNFKGTAEDLHFRTAESQFYRLLSDQGGRYKVVKVEYVVTPDLVKRFRSAQESLKNSRGEMNAQPILAFHGTDEGNIKKICEKGFLMHGDPGFQMKSGNKYGSGVYFSEYPDYSMQYIRGSTKLLLCKVMLGKTYTISSFSQGSVHPGYDSHTSACGKELVIFDTARILPSYIVHYK
ncbi:protein mono-ADP-ribosyltransferase PARP14-like [Haliotis rufescens]|uniref:protein mono-ADP-ribosyltransferase PARP14-like n=1 Tax=Haliotis rufescens TaxID=6454 RepID=UPI00201ECCFE|nr:protein mono-ADP-ribosyltransferase PARP14-like [Haliotis rufescens]